MKPIWIVGPSAAPDWKLNAGAFGFEAAATYWLILTNGVTPTSRVPTVPKPITTLSTEMLAAVPPALSRTTCAGTAVAALLKNEPRWHAGARGGPAPGRRGGGSSA